MLKLPTDVCIYIIGEWLDFASFGSLDIALGSKGERKEFLSLIKSKEFVYTGNALQLVNNSKLQLCWILNREIKIEKLIYRQRKYYGTLKLFEVVGVFRPFYGCLRSLILDDVLGNSIRNEVFEEVVGCCTSLTNLRLFGNVTVYPNSWPFSGILKSLFLLTTVITSQSIIAIGQMCVNIEELGLRCTNYVQDTGFPSHSNFRSLTELQTNNLPVEAIEYLLSSASDIKCLEVSGITVSSMFILKCKSVTDLSALTWTGDDVNDDFSQFLLQSPQLQHLRLNTVTFKVFDNCFKVLSNVCHNMLTLIFCSDKYHQYELMAVAVSKMPLLTNVTLAYNVSLEALISDCPKIKNLTLEEILNVDNIFNKIPRAFPLLERISINSGEATNELLFELSKHCPNLKDAMFCHGYKLIDDSIIALLMECLNLHTLNAGASYLTTDNLVHGIISYGTNLRYLDLCADNFTPSIYKAFNNIIGIVELTFNINSNAYDTEADEAIRELAVARKARLEYAEDDDNYTYVLHKK